MPDLAVSVSLPWRDASPLVGGGVGLPWRDALLVVSSGGPFVKPPAPPDATPTTPPSLDATYVLPAADAYDAVHEVTVVDLTDDVELEFEQLTISDEDGSICRTLSASGRGPDLFARMTTLDPPVLRVTIDGMAWRFVVETARRSREHGKYGVSITGRSVTVLAGEPYVLPAQWVNEGPATAAQIVEMAQLFTSLGIRWDLVDWLVPDRVWSYTGSPLAVAQRVAETVGAVVVSDRADLALTIQPRYRDLPHEWPTVAPDVEIHLDAVMADSYERADRPSYNAAYVSGQQQGVTGLVRVEGTAGDKLAPYVTDLLLTDPDAVRQRGIAILGASGPQAVVTHTLPVLTGAGRPGVLERGMLCRMVGDGPTWWGVVRSVSVSVSLPSVMQTVAMERHTAYLPGTVVTEAP